MDTRLNRRGGGICLSLEIDPPIRNPIAVGQSPTRQSLRSESARGDVCLGQQLDADPDAVTFEPVWAPFNYQGPDFRRQVIGGAASPDAQDLGLELASGDTAPVTLRDGGLFVEFPHEEVVALRMTLDGVPWRCEPGAASTFDLCQRIWEAGTTADDGASGGHSGQ